MGNKTAVKATALLLLFSIFSACGELSTPLFSPGGSYQIRAMVNGSSLESCSIIRQNDKITPYFAMSVVNDPDLMGLLVYLQDSKGDIVGDKVLYTTDPVNQTTQQNPPQEGTNEDNEFGEDTDPDEGMNAEEESDGETAEQTEGEEEDEPLVREKLTFIESKTPVKEYDVVIPIKSFEDKMPHFPMPKDLEIGQYSLVFEAVGRHNTLSSTELSIFYLGNVEFKLNDISMYLPWLSDTSLIPVGATVMLEAGLDFDSRLNPYVIWYNGKNIISEGSISEGAGHLLWKAPEQAGFYPLKVEVLPYKLKRTFTGIFREITLPVSTKASSTGYFFGNGPDYAAKRPLAAGTVYAEQLQFVRANAATNGTAIPPEYPELLRWYRFEGDLNDKSSIQERMLEAANGKFPRWAAVGQSFGLSVGPDDTYTLRPISFLRQGKDQGGGIFLFHIRPAIIEEEILFNAFFPTLESVNDGVWMDMVMRENGVMLRLKTNETSVEIPVDLASPELTGLIPIAVEFYIRPYRFEAKLTLGEDRSMQGITGELKLSHALSGEGKIRLGGNKTVPADSGVKKAEIPSETSASADEIPAGKEEPSLTKTVQPANSTTVWDEFAVLYSTTPLLPEEIIAEADSETQDAPKEETAATSIKKPAQETVAKPSPAAKEETKPNPADNKPVPEAESPLIDIQAENTPIEPAAAIEIRQVPDRRPVTFSPANAETETVDEGDVRLLFSIQ
jgi:hypothetical protein